MADITLTFRFSQSASQWLGLNQLELGTETLLKLWHTRWAPAPLWLYLGLLLLPAKHWQARGLLNFGTLEDLRAALLDPELRRRLATIATQLYAVQRQLQRVLLSGVSDEVRWEQEAWRVLESEYKRQLEELPVRPQATKEKKIVQGFQPMLVPALWQALEESTWLPRVQARLALEQFQAELADPPRLEVWLWELMRQQLVGRANQSHVVLALPEILWETQVQTPPRTGTPRQYDLE